MKNINKKASAIALSGIAVSGVFLSNVPTVNADNSAPNKVDLTYDQIQDRRMVVKHEDDYNYSSEQLYSKPKRIDGQYSNRWVFEKNIKNDLNTKYKGKNCINIQIENKSWFKLIPNKFTKLHNRLIWNELVAYQEKHNFKILIYQDISTSNGRMLFDTKLRTIFGKNEDLKNRLLNRIFTYYDDIHELTRTANPSHLFKEDGYFKVVVDDLAFLLQK